MAEANENLCTPWRMQYIANFEREKRESGCFLCRYRDTPERDRESYVLWRSVQTLVLLNRYPYTNGHLLVAPALHVSSLSELPDEMLIELTLRIRDAQRVLKEVVAAHGFNIGINIGACAGAGLPEHLHWHIVPRWTGDTSFMASVGDVRLIPQSLDAVFEQFCASAARLGLPTG